MTNKIDGRLFMVGPLLWDTLRREGGLLPDSSDEEVVYSFCAWYFCRCAHIAIHEITSQVSYEGDTDVTVQLRGVLRGCMKAYGLDAESGDVIERVMKRMPLCRQLAFRRNIFWSDRFQAWLDSGGRAYNEVTREPDAI